MMRNIVEKLSCIEICAGGGGLALGLEQAGFQHKALIEIDSKCCDTLRYNRPDWNVIEEDIRNFDAKPYSNIDLLAGGIPCPPFSIAGKQLGRDDERDLFPEVIRMVSELNPTSILIENVKGLLSPRFLEYRTYIESQFDSQGYKIEWKLLNACEYGVSQDRQRVVIIGFKKQMFHFFNWPNRYIPPLSIGSLLGNLMGENGWENVKGWIENANNIAPTIVGGSKKHGGPDLGPTRTKKAWLNLGVDATGIANEAPYPDFMGLPKLTLKMVAKIQGFPADWYFLGKKTSVYRQIGNAFPPPLAFAVASHIYNATLNMNIPQVIK